MSNESKRFVDYWFLTMALRFLNEEDDLNKKYEVAKVVFSMRGKYGLEFPEGYTMEYNISKAAQDKGGVEDAYLIGRKKRKTEDVHEQLKLAAERINPQKVKKGDLENNIELLAKALQFSPLQTKLLLFFACAPLGSFMDLVEAQQDRKTYEDYIKSLAYFLKADAEDVKKELEPESTLVGVQFLGFQEGQGHFLDKAVQKILKRNFKSEEELLRGMIGPSPKSELTPENFMYMGREFEEIVSTVEGYVKDPDAGRKNITLAGPPGTGKTEGTAVIGEMLGIPVFLVGTTEKVEGQGFSMEEPSREDRIRALIRSAFIVRQTKMKAILVLDEAEDILRDLNREETKDKGSKAFTNEILESLGVTVIFISNRTDLFDPATIRRILPFYYMHYMPLEERMKAVQAKVEKYTGVKLEIGDVETIAEKAEHLTIAVIDTCIKSVAKRALHDPQNPQSLLDAIEREVTRSITAANKGVPPVPQVEVLDDVERFDPKLVRASEDIVVLRDHFEQARKADKGRLAGMDIAVVGPNGTGRKSIAKQLALAAGFKPRVIPFDLGSAVQAPGYAHAMDLLRGNLDGRALIFDAMGEFPIIAGDHPLMNRIRAHPFPTFFVGEYVEKVPNFARRLTEAFTLSVRTGPLTAEQIQYAGRSLLGVEVSQDLVTGLKDVRVADVERVSRQLQALGQGDAEGFVTRLAKDTRLHKPLDCGPGIGFGH